MEQLAGPCEDWEAPGLLQGMEEMTGSRSRGVDRICMVAKSRASAGLSPLT